MQTGDQPPEPAPPPGGPARTIGWAKAKAFTSATELYGAPGIATTILFWLSVVGRLVIAGATLNASLTEQRTERTMENDA